MNGEYCLIVAAGTIDNYTTHREMLAQLPQPSCIYSADGGLRHLAPLGLTPDLLLGDFDSIDSELFKSHKLRGVKIERYPPDKDFTDTELAVARATVDGYKHILIFGAFGARIDHTYANIQLMYKYALIGINIVLADSYGMMRIIVSGSELEVSADKPLQSLLGLYDYMCYKQLNILCNEKNSAHSPDAPAPIPDLISTHTGATAPATVPTPTTTAPTTTPADQPTPAPSSTSFPTPSSSAILAPSPARIPTFANLKLSLLPIGGPVSGITASGVKYAFTNTDLDASYTSGVSNEFTERAAKIKITEGALLVMICSD